MNVQKSFSELLGVNGSTELDIITIKPLSSKQLCKIMYDSGRVELDTAAKKAGKIILEENPTVGTDYTARLYVWAMTEREKRRPAAGTFGARGDGEWDPQYRPYLLFCRVCWAHAACAGIRMMHCAINPFAPLSYSDAHIPSHVPSLPLLRGRT